MFLTHWAHPRKWLPAVIKQPLYYLSERASGSGLLLFVYNKVTVDTTYDRAVFFFDSDKTLIDFSTFIKD